LKSQVNYLNGESMQCKAHFIALLSLAFRLLPIPSFLFHSYCPLCSSISNS